MLIFSLRKELASEVVQFISSSRRFMTPFFLLLCLVQLVRMSHCMHYLHPTAGKVVKRQLLHYVFVLLFMLRERISLLAELHMLFNDDSVFTEEVTCDTGRLLCPKAHLSLRDLPVTTFHLRYEFVRTPRI